MRKTFKYRIYGSQQTIAKAEYWLDLCRFLYNCALEERIDYYKHGYGTLHKYAQIKEITEMKQELPEYKNVHAQTLQQVIERLDEAYSAFFRRVKSGKGKPGFPRFKSKNRYDSFTLKNWGWQLDGKYLTIRNVGKFKLKLSRPIMGDIKRLTIKRVSTNKWYVYFSCNDVLEKLLLQSDEVIGLDVGITSFVVDSDGNKVDNPKYLKHSLKILRRKQRKLARREKGSKRRNKARVLVAKTHEKISNQRLDFLHKTANYYVRNYGIIYIEDLNIQGMVQNHCLARDILDAGWGTFFGLLSYKAEEAGRKVIKRPRFEPSSKRCSACGAINHDLKLSDRVWVCKVCGTVHDRDINAARNTGGFGQNLQALTKEPTLCVA